MGFAIQTPLFCQFHGKTIAFINFYVSQTYKRVRIICTFMLSDLKF